MNDVTRLIALFALNKIHKLNKGARSSFKNLIARLYHDI